MVIRTLNSLDKSIYLYVGLHIIVTINTMAKNKTGPTKASVIDFINNVPNETRKKDGFYILEMMNRITNLPPVMWGPTGIAYGYYQYKYKSGHGGEAGLIGFSPRKQHLVLYVLNNFQNQQELLDKLGKHKTGSICLYINKLADVNLDVLEEIVLFAYNRVKHKNERLR